jgi:DivIVA domain-containing protein
MAADERQPAQQAVTPRTAQPTPGGLDDLREHVPADIRNVRFPVSVRGYDRDAVEAFVKRVNRVIAELEISRSPRAAVRHALDRVGKQTVAVLQEARESADKLLEAARDEADAEKERAKAEAAKLVVNASDEADRTRAEADQVLAEAKAQASQIVAKAQAEAAKDKQEADAEIAAVREKAGARMREIQSDTEAVWNERGRLLEETQAMAQKLQELASGAAARLGVDRSEQQTMVVEPQPRKRAEKKG